MRPRIAIGSVTTLLVSLTASFLALETAIRILRMAPPLSRGYGSNIRDPYLPYRPAPFSVEHGLTDGIEHEYRHNSFGLRDAEHSLEKGAGVFRILGIGDSFTYGAGASLEDTYLSRLESMLNGRPGDHPKVEIIKAGIPRSYPATQRLFLEHYGLKYAPDLVLVGFVPNDVIDTYFGPDAIVVDPSGYLETREAAELGTLATVLYRKSHVFRIVLGTYVKYRIATNYQPHWEDVFRAGGYHERDWQQIESEYEKMAAVASRAKATIVFVHIPQNGPWREEHSYPAARLAAWAAKTGVHFVDVLRAMRAANKASGPLYYPVDGHCMPAGYSVVAAQIYAYLAQRSLVP